MPKRGDSLGDSPAPLQDSAFSARVTTEGLRASISRWKVSCHLLWIDGSQPPVHAPLINIDIEKPQVVKMVEKQTVIFLLDSGPFLCLTFLSWSPVQ
jgi:hypothetical protein